MSEHEPIGFLFPGQGAQYIGMGETLYRQSPAAQEVFAEASRVLQWDVPQLCFEDPQDVMNLTEYTQPLLLTVSVASYRAFTEQYPSVKPACMAGLSLGEYSALVAAGSLNLAEAVGLVRLRGRYMQEAVPRGVGGMAAVIGLSAQEVERICSEVSTAEAWVEPANYNCPGQVVVAGHLALVKTFCQAAKAAGATRAAQLPVSAPFHNRLLRPAGNRLAEALEQVSISDARVPVIANVSAEPVTGRAEIRQGLIEQVYNPVRMEQSLRLMLSQGIHTFVEFGPGDTLAKFVKRMDESAGVASIGDIDSLDAYQVAMV